MSDEAATARDAALGVFEEYRGEVLAVLRAYATGLYEQVKRPLSTNDLRPVLNALEYDGDYRILGSVFRTSGWVIAGDTQVDDPICHKRPIRTFVPAT